MKETMNFQDDCEQEFSKLLSARYGCDIDATASTNTVINTLLKHASCRRYSSKPLPENILSTLMASAQSAASSCNMHNWSVIVVENPEDKEKIAALCGGQKQVALAPLLLVFVADLARLESIANINGAPSEALDYIDMLLVGAIDAAIAAQNMVVAAESLGIGTCYLGAIRNNPKQVCQLLELPNRVAPLVGLTLGYPAEDCQPKIKPRLDVSSVLHFNTYNLQNALQPVADYETAMDTFNISERRNEDKWGAKVAKKVATRNSQDGREKLWQTLKEQGFALK